MKRWKNLIMIKTLIFTLLVFIGMTARGGLPLGLYLTHWYGGNGYSAADYIQDGLIFHIDGIENLDYGVGDNSLTWNDLKRKYTTELTEYVDRTFDGYGFRRPGALGIINWVPFSNSYGHIEIVYSADYNTVSNAYRHLIVGSRGANTAGFRANFSRFSMDGYSGWGTTLLSTWGASYSGFTPIAPATQTRYNRECLTLSMPRFLDTSITTNYWVNGTATALKLTFMASGNFPINLRVIGAGFNPTESTVGDVLSNVNNVKKYFDLPALVTIHAIRVYSRILSLDEVEFNRYIDEFRFLGVGE